MYKRQALRGGPAPGAQRVEGRRVAARDARQGCRAGLRPDVVDLRERALRRPLPGGARQEGGHGAGRAHVVGRDASRGRRSAEPAHRHGEGARPRRQSRCRRRAHGRGRAVRVRGRPARGCRRRRRRGRPPGGCRDRDQGQAVAREERVQAVERARGRADARGIRRRRGHRARRGGGGRARVHEPRQARLRHELPRPGHARQRVRRGARGGLPQLPHRQPRLEGRAYRRRCQVRPVHRPLRPANRAGRARGLGHSHHASEDRVREDQLLQAGRLSRAASVVPAAGQPLARDRAHPARRLRVRPPGCAVHPPPFARGLHAGRPASGRRAGRSRQDQPARCLLYTSRCV